MPKPVIGLVADCREHGGQHHHSVGEKYLLAVARGAGARPVILPCLGGLYDAGDLSELVSGLDGLCLTGSPSNVHPSRYGAQATPAHAPHDIHRDGTTLPLILETLRQAVPLLAICRGFQELNVALGGTLHPRLHSLPGMLDHREPLTEDPALRYGPRHSVRLNPHGQLIGIARAATLQVNSLHGQGIDRLARALVAEAVAPDGLVEAVRVQDTEFALGVQWHPEYRALENPFSAKLFAAFGAAAEGRRQRDWPGGRPSRLAGSGARGPGGGCHPGRPAP